MMLLLWPRQEEMTKHFNLNDGGSRAVADLSAITVSLHRDDGHADDMVVKVEGEITDISESIMFSWRKVGLEEVQPASNTDRHDPEKKNCNRINKGMINLSDFIEDMEPVDLALLGGVVHLEESSSRRELAAAAVATVDFKFPIAAAVVANSNSSRGIDFKSPVAK
ncbi:hypothetical protein MTR67_036185 [Solanum verrucosum]|uniref:Uncharacterized protein n=1 Tax=Solanum verrucosum TaxID=315347 RepID=A0AAF0ZMC1_SOLVR|nr:hypothetical protein MTR67_036185 [Solanum verrucosum]